MMGDRRKEIIDLSGQIINGMMSADSSMLTKVLDMTLHKNIARIAVNIAFKIIEEIDKQENKNEKERIRINH